MPTSPACRSTTVVDRVALGDQARGASSGSFDGPGGVLDIEVEPGSARLELPNGMVTTATFNAAGWLIDPRPRTRG